MTSGFLVMETLGTESSVDCVLCMWLEALFVYMILFKILLKALFISQVCIMYRDKYMVAFYVD